MAATTCPLFLITGFLGSGKSTLLSRLIRDPGFADTAVIVNEFGEVGLDHALVSAGEEDNTVRLDSGCICCSLTSSLEETLEALYYKRERGEIPAFTRVVVETTGLADPGPIANALAGGPFVSRFFHLAAIVTTVDSVHGAAQLAAFDEARTQVAMADRIIQTKGDLATPDQAAATAAALDDLAPHAERLRAVAGAIAADLVLSAGAPAPMPTPMPAAACAPGCEHPDHDHTHGRGHGHGHGPEPEHGPEEGEGHVERHGFVSQVLRLEAPVSWAGYAAWVRRLQAALGERLLRVKGVLAFDDGGVYAVQGVKLLFDPPRRLDWTPAPGLTGTLVVIARHADPAELAASRAWFDAPEP